MKLDRALWVVLIFCFSQAVAQPSVELENYRKQYPGESVILLNKKQSVDISIEGRELSILTEYYEEHFFLDSKAPLYSEESIAYSGFYDIFDIRAKTLVPSKRNYKAVNVKQITEKDELNAGIFYDDIKSKNFIYPLLQEGAKTSLFYRQKTKDPHFLKSFYLAEVMPIESEEFVIRSDKNIEIAFTYFNTTAEEAGFSRTETDQQIIYRWVKKKVPKLTLESSAPSHLNYIPHIIPRVASYTVNGEKIRVLSDVSDLHQWYYSLINRMDRSRSDELVKITDSLTRGVETEFEKVKAIYRWVQNNIKYIAVEDGLGGFIPRDPKTVCENRYGDCKDMSNIIIQMLDIAGIESHVTWVGTRDIPYTYKNVPTPGVDNHMIATYIKDSVYYFLDATGQFSPIDLPSAFIQGKEVMINYGENFELVKVPETPARVSQIMDTVNLQLEDGKLTGTATVYFTGYQKIELTERVSRLDDHNRIRFFKDYFNKGSNKFLIDDLSVENLLDNHRPLIIRYRFNIADYANHNDDEIYLNMSLDKLFLNATIEKDRKQAIERDYKTLITNVVRLKLPEGYQAVYLPEKSSFEVEKFDYNIDYRVEGTYLVQDSRITIDHLLLKPDQFGKWNEMIKNLNQAYSESVLLKEQ